MGSFDDGSTWGSKSGQFECIEQKGLTRINR